jgi:hypothetical protein
MTRDEAYMWMFGVLTQGHDRHDVVSLTTSTNHVYFDDASVKAVQDSLEAMVKLYGGERVAKWVRDLTFLIERKELP